MVVALSFKWMVILHSFTYLTKILLNKRVAILYLFTVSMLRYECCLLLPLFSYCVSRPVIFGAWAAIRRRRWSGGSPLRMECGLRAWRNLTERRLVGLAHSTSWPTIADTLKIMPRTRRGHVSSKKEFMGMRSVRRGGELCLSAGVRCRPAARRRGAVRGVLPSGVPWRGVHRSWRRVRGVHSRRGWE
ncbi:hypothetical protein TcBrA4_0012530, partial [Trypanosoma cruzi]